VRDKIVNVLTDLILTPVLFLLFISAFVHLIYALIFGIEGRTVTFTLQIGKRTFKWIR
jgi:hypothetical protein